MTPTMRTASDFYRSVTSPWKGEQSPPRHSLEEYLRALWKIVGRSAGVVPTNDDIVRFLVEAARAEPAAFDRAWMDLPSPPPGQREDSHREWEKLILFQIADLRRMAQAGTLDDPMHAWGTTSPSGQTWHKFHPLDFLEAGARGLLGDGDDLLHSLGWRGFAEILATGQIYE